LALPGRGYVLARFGAGDRDIAAIYLYNFTTTTAPVFFGTLGVGEGPFPKAGIDVSGI
jgi:hypothetical protein